MFNEEQVLTVIDISHQNDLKIKLMLLIYVLSCKILLFLILLENTIKIKHGIYFTQILKKSSPILFTPLTEILRKPDQVIRSESMK